MKFKVGGKFELFSFDAQAYMQDLNDHMTIKLKETGIHWLDNTVRTRTHIPTWSGASRSTFQKLAVALGTTVPIGPIRSLIDRTWLGYASSSGGLSLQPSKGTWSFFYQTSLNYLIYNEKNRAVPGPPPQPFSHNVRYTPYNFQAKGVRAFFAFASRVRLPSVKKYIRKRKVSV